MMKYSSEEYHTLYMRLLKLHKDTGGIHAGGSISVLPVLYVLFSGLFDSRKDFLVYSKGHTVFALYCVLALRGFLDEAELEHCCADGVKLGAHPPKGLVPFSPFATGSLGHGFSLSAGLALGKKLKHQDGRIFCVCGDGEFQEGSCWEALIFSVSKTLDNITLIIDCNGWQGFGAVNDVAGYGIEGLKERLSSFGAEVSLCDVHDFDELAACLGGHTEGKLSVVLVHSIKGEGLGDYQDTLDSHYIRIDDRMIQEAGC